MAIDFSKIDKDAGETVESRKDLYAAVEHIREGIDNAFYNWRSQDISVGQRRPKIEDLVIEIEMCIHPIKVIKQTVYSTFEDKIRAVELEVAATVDDSKLKAAELALIKAAEALSYARREHELKVAGLELTALGL
jgi:hypothetical protein